MTPFDRALRRFKVAVVALLVSAAFYVGVQVYLLATGRR